MPNVRLPRNAVPKRYVIELFLDPKNRSFSGKESISAELFEKSKVISLNAKCLDILNIRVVFGDSVVIPKSVNYNQEFECLSIEFDDEISPCNFTLDLEFSGRIVTNALYGLYLCVDSVGNETLASHFQTSFARCAFPCWDEPSFKSEFVLSVFCPSEFAEFEISCISNMPVEKESRNENGTTFKFMKTPVMSTYLLGLVIGKFDVLTTETSHGVPVRVFTPKGKSSFGQFALETAASIIPYYEDFFKVPFMLPKVDIVSVAEHSFVAMENWGVMIFREANLLLDKEAAEVRKMQVAQLIGHELAHQWFGNLVTCSWWSDIWLNEGFAEWTEYLTISRFFPKRKAWLEFLHTEQAEALAFDGLSTAHPLEASLQSAAETVAIFDSITYAKGCSLVRMVYNFIGEQNFREGLALYLNKFAYKNATTTDLWQVFDSVSGMEISKVMQSYVTQAGFPFLEVSFNGNGMLEVAVETFSAHGRENAKKREALVSLKCNGPKTGETKALSAFSLNGKVEFQVKNDDGRLVVANPGAVWLCRVSYPGPMWRKLGLTAMKDSAICSEERFALSNDLFAFAMGGYPGGYSVAKWLAFITTYAESEPSYAVWKDIIAKFANVAELAMEYELSSSLKVFIQKLFSHRFSILSWDKKPKEEPEDSELRSLLIKTLGFVDDETVVANCQVRFQDHMSGKNVIPDELKQAILSVVAYHGGKEEYKQLFRLFDEAQTDDIRGIILSAIGCFQDAETRDCLLSWLEQPNMPIGVQSLPVVLSGMSMSLEGRQAGLEFFLKNWSKLATLCAGSSGILFGRIVNSVVSDFCDASVAELLEVQLDNEPMPSAKLSIDQTCDQLRVQANWAARDGTNLRQFFNSFSDPALNSFSKIFDFYFPEK